MIFEVRNDLLNKHKWNNKNILFSKSFNIELYSLFSTQNRYPEYENEILNMIRVFFL